MMFRNRKSAFSSIVSLTALAIATFANPAFAQSADIDSAERSDTDIIVTAPSVRNPY